MTCNLLFRRSCNTVNPYLGHILATFLQISPESLLPKLQLDGRFNLSLDRNFSYFLVKRSNPRLLRRQIEPCLYGLRRLLESSYSPWQLRTARALVLYTSTSLYRLALVELVCSLSHCYFGSNLHKWLLLIVKFCNKAETNS
jgi:hypothetical protein